MQTTASKQSPANSTEPLQVLVVDDDPLVLRLMAAILESAGCGVVTENNGYRAIQQVLKQPFDVVFSDLKMPTSGVVATKEILDARPDTQVVIVTGYPDSDETLAALAYGARVCIPKPFEPATILQELQQISAERKRAIGGRSHPDR
jgi:CheY-like chemotaxis protein